MKAARAWSAALARNVRRRASIRRPGSQALKVARGSVPTAETEGIEYRLRRPLADRSVVAGRSLLAGVGVERRGRLIRNDSFVQPGLQGPGRRRSNMPKPDEKPFVIPRSMVWEAWRRVKANKGAPGVDGQDLAQFEADLRNDLYKLWNVRSEC